MLYEELSQRFGSQMVQPFREPVVIIDAKDFRKEWEEQLKAEGQKGEFEKSEDVNNPEFKAMLKDLQSHGGKLTRNGMFYWVYKNGSTVGRKKRGVSQP